MDTNTTIGTICGLIGGFAISYLFYKLTVSKSLGFFLLLDDLPLSHVSPDVRPRLAITFLTPEPPPATDGAERDEAARARPVGSLQHLQLIVRNTGIRAINFSEQPTIDFPADQQILDASIVYQWPDRLRASLARVPVVEGGLQQIRFSIPLLNKGDYFIAKFLLSDAIDSSQLQLNLLAEDLPRTIDLERLPPDSTKSWWESIDWAAIWIGLVLMAVAVSSGFVANALLQANPFVSPFGGNFSAFLSSVKGIHLMAALSLVGAVAIGFVGFLFVIGMGLQPWATKKRIVLPTEFRPG